MKTTIAPSTYKKEPQVKRTSRRITCVLAVGLLSPLAMVFSLPAMPENRSAAEVSLYAKEFNMTNSKAESELVRQDQLSQLVTKIAGIEGRRVAGYGIRRNPDVQGWVSLVGKKPAKRATRRLLKKHRDIRLSYNARHSLSALKRAQQRVGAANLAGLRDRVAATSIDMVTNALRVSLASDTQGSQRRSRDARVKNQAVDLTTRRRIASVARVKVRFDQQQPLTPVNNASDEASTRALQKQQSTFRNANFGGEFGASHILSDWGTGLAPYAYACTAGFTVRDRLEPSRTGFLTAGRYCPNNLVLDYNVEGVPDMPLYFQKENLLVDAQFNEIDPYWGEVRPKYWSHIASKPETAGWVPVTSTMTSTRAGMQGVWLCHYGISTYTSCGDVVEPFYDTNVDGYAESVRVEGEYLRMSSNDIGGPVFTLYSKLAYGIVTGGSWSGSDYRQTSYVLFSPIKEIEDALNVDVLIDN